MLPRNLLYSTYASSDVPSGFPESLWHTLGIDLIGPMSFLPITVMDYHSKFSFVYFMSDIQTSNIVQAFSNLFSSEGIPVLIMCDNGPQFTFGEFQNFLTSFNIQQKTTPVFHPKANGLIERFH